MLTKTQIKIFSFIQQYFAAYSMSPTLAEIAAGVDIKSRGVVHRYVQELAKKNYISLIPKKRRNIRLKAPHLTQLPLILQHSETATNIDIVTSIFGSNKDRFLFKITDDSMIEKNICNGDIVIYRKTSRVRNGDIVMALVDNTEPTLKKIHKTNEHITLIPANKNHEAITYSVERVQIHGKYVGLLRLDQ